MGTNPPCKAPMAQKTSWNFACDTLDSNYWAGTDWDTKLSTTACWNRDIQRGAILATSASPNPDMPQTCKLNLNTGLQLAPGSKVSQIGVSIVQDLTFYPSMHAALAIDSQNERISLFNDFHPEEILINQPDGRLAINFILTMDADSHSDDVPKVVWTIQSINLRPICAPSTNPADCTFSGENQPAHLQ